MGFVFFLVDTNGDFESDRVLRDKIAIGDICGLSLVLPLEVGVIRSRMELSGVPICIVSLGIHVIGLSIHNSVFRCHESVTLIKTDKFKCEYATEKSSIFNKSP